MTIPHLEGNDTKGFLDEVFRGATCGFLVVGAKLGPRGLETHSFHVSEIAQAAEAMQVLAQRGEVYFERGLQGVRPGAGKRGNEAGVTWVGGLSIDFDTREGPHATEPDKLPADLKEVRKLFLEASVPEPTLIIHTGGGVHAHWLYAVPVLMASAGERAAEKTMAKAWSKRLEKVFKVQGYHLDSTYSLEHLFKAPGTLNHKESPSLKPVTLVSTGHRYEQAELRKLLANELKTAARGIPGAGPGTLAAQFAETAKKAFLASNKAKPDELPPILAGCAWLQSIVERADRGEKLTEEEWYAMISIVARTTEGRKWVHEISKRDPEERRYSFEGTEAKIEHALKDAGPANCRETVQEKLKFEVCNRCPFRGLVTSPMNLGPEPAERVGVQRDTIFAQQGRIYLRLSDGERFDVPSYSDGMLSRVGDNPHYQLMKSKKTAIVTRLGYVPGDHRLIMKNERGTLIANQWQPGGVVPGKGDEKPVLEFFERFIPDTRSRKHVIQYLAHLYQRPAVKIEHGLTVSGGYGTGKGTLREIVAKLFGEHNIQKIEGGELEDKNNARWVDKQVLIVEETYHKGKYETYNRTKSLVVDDKFPVQDKYVKTYEGTSPRGILVTTNEDAPMFIPEGDRRWFICVTPPTPEDDEMAEHRAFFKGFRDLLKRDDTAVAAFAYYLQHEVDLSEFPSKGAPPMTAAKERAINASRTPLADGLVQLIRNGAPPYLHKDVVSYKDVLRALQTSDWSHLVTSTAPQKIIKAIKDTGGCAVHHNAEGRHLPVRFSRTEAYELYAIRSRPRWRKASLEELKAEHKREPGAPTANVYSFNEAANMRDPAYPVTSEAEIEAYRREAEEQRDTLFSRLMAGAS
ncbi:primase-helicase family protein [Methylobacterium brachiatum]|uniref:Primase-helicase family protein n=1 Tax=Methylobacterium brachiatum TaxID=269660 RepID=A0ABV1R4B6_9HYPH